MGSYLIEGRPYPRVILGSDRFLDIFPKKPPAWQLTEEHVFSVMESALGHGAHGFDLSTMSRNVLAAFARLRNKYPDRAIGIGDPNWRCGYKLGSQHLMDLKPRILKTIVEERLTEAELFSIGRLPEKNYNFWFSYDRSQAALTTTEIDEIYLDDREWSSRLDQLDGIANFCLFGADYADWMLLLGRDDLLKSQIESIRRRQMIPIAVCHWTSLTLPQLDKLAVGGHWTLGNLEQMYFSTSSAISAAQDATKPVTCFRTLRGIERPAGIAEAIGWLRRTVGVSSVVVGVDNEEQAAYTIPIAASVLSSDE